MCLQAGLPAERKRRHLSARVVLAAPVFLVVAFSLLTRMETSYVQTSPSRIAHLAQGLCPSHWPSD
jgi:hypothetical protein